MASGPIASLRHAWSYRRMLPYYIPQILRRALFFAFMIALPLTAHETLNVPSSRVGGFFILSALITTFLMPFAGKLADRIAPAHLVVVTMLMMGFTIVCFGLAHRLSAFSALFVVETIAFAFMQPAGMKVFANIVDKHPERSNVVGVFGSIAELSTVPVALFVPPLFAAAPALSWFAIGLPCLVGALPFMRYRPPIAAAITQDTMANTTPMRPPQ
jgi:MFS family permease